MTKRELQLVVGALRVHSVQRPSRAQYEMLQQARNKARDWFGSYEPGPAKFSGDLPIERSNARFLELALEKLKEMP